MQVCSLFSPPRGNVCYVVTYLKYGVLETTFLGLKSTRHATDCCLLLRIKICTLTHCGPRISPYRRVCKDSEECIIASYLARSSPMSEIFDIILFSFEFHSLKFPCSSQFQISSLHFSYIVWVQISVSIDDDTGATLKISFLKFTLRSPE